MERYPKRIQTQELKDVADYIFGKALGNFVIAESAPTADTLVANQFVYYNGEIFFKTANNVSFKFTVTLI